MPARRCCLTRKQDDNLNELREALKANVEELCLALLGKPDVRTGSEWRWGKSGALSVVVRGPKKGLWNNHAGAIDKGEGDLLGLIRRERGGSFADTVRWARGFVGISEAEGWRPHKRKARPQRDRQKEDEEQAAEEAKRVLAAQRIAQEAVMIEPGSLADRYLTETRKITRPADGWGPALGFHIGRKALVLRATMLDGTVRAVQLIHLNDQAQKISAEEAEARSLPGAKQTRGVLAGALVRLAGSGAVLLLAEGPETGLTCWAATGRETWIALGSVAKLDLPQGRALLVAADDDRRDAPAAVALRKGVAAWKRAGRKVSTITPWGRRRYDKTDFNDLAQQVGMEAVRVRLEDVLAPATVHYSAPMHPPAEAMAALEREVDGFADEAAEKIAIHAEWDALKSEIEETTETRTLERRRALRAGRRAMAAKHGKGWRSLGRRILLPAAAGGGKTTLMARAICRVGKQLRRVFFATDTIANAEAVAARIPGAMVMRGRSQPDPLSTEGKSMCWRPDAAMKVARAGLPVSRTLCDNGEGKRCALYDLCGWQREARKMREIETGVFCGSHEYLNLPGPMPRPDVVIIDENPLGVMVDRVGFGVDRVLPDAQPGWQKAGPVVALQYREIMVKVEAAVRSQGGILAALRESGITTADHLKPAITYLRKVEDEDYTSDLSPDMADEAIMERLNQYQRSEISSVLKMLMALAAEIELPRGIAHGVSFDPNYTITVDGRRERQARVFVHYRKRPAFKDRVPMMILDASGDVEVYRRLFGERLEVVDAVRCERHAYVVQVGDATFVQGTLSGTDRKGNALSDDSEERAERIRGQLADVANALAHRHGSLMLAVNKMVEELIAPVLCPEVVTGHYGALRGRNDFEHCDAGMIVGRMEPPAWAMEDIARALHAEDPEPLDLPGEYEKTRRGIRMRDGSAVMVEVNTHRDPRVQRVLELHRERESEQAADRLRLIHNPDPKTLYVAGNVPLDLTVDRIVSWSEFMREVTGRLSNGRSGTGRRFYGNRLAEAFRLGGEVLPLSRSELMRLYGPEGQVFRGLWGSERVLREDLGKGGERWRTQQWSISITESAIFPVRVVRYRKEGQRCPSRALVGVPESLARSALEALVGTLVFFDIEPSPDPELAAPGPRPNSFRPTPENPGGPKASDTKGERTGFDGDEPPADGQSEPDSKHPAGDTPPLRTGLDGSGQAENSHPERDGAPGTGAPDLEEGVIRRPPREDDPPSPPSNTLAEIFAAAQRRRQPPPAPS